MATASRAHSRCARLAQHAHVVAENRDGSSATPNPGRRWKRARQNRHPFFVPSRRKRTMAVICRRWPGLRISARVARTCRDRDRAVPRADHAAGAAFACARGSAKRLPDRRRLQVVVVMARTGAMSGSSSTTFSILSTNPTRSDVKTPARSGGSRSFNGISPTSWMLRAAALGISKGDG